MKEQLEIFGLAQKLKIQIAAGNSVLSFIKLVLNRENLNKEHRKYFLILLSNPTSELRGIVKSKGLQKLFWEILQKGLNGCSVYLEIEHFIDEIERQLDLEVERRLKLLPLFLSFFLLVFIFPAYLILLMGPVLGQLF